MLVAVMADTSPFIKAEAAKILTFFFTFARANHILGIVW
jgi:hypothetical protein